MDTLTQRQLNRMIGHNYSDPGYYFVTFNITMNSTYFGQIQSGIMIYNEIGKIAERFIKQIEIHYQNIIVDMAIIMPNHIHAIIIVGEPYWGVYNDHPAPIVGTGHCSVRLSYPPAPDSADMPFHKYGLLSKVVKSYKEIITKTIRLEHPETNFQWQRSFYDHIIRDSNALKSIREYIRLNPINWESDLNNINNHANWTEEARQQQLYKHYDQLCSSLTTGTPSP